jgi:hypothetical protein
LGGSTTKREQMDSAKIKIEEIITNYRALHNAEYRLFINSLRKTRTKNLNKFASFKADDMLERKLVELPDKLFRALKEKLSEEEYAWLFPAYDPSIQGMKWFAKKFPEFMSGDVL